MERDRLTMKGLRAGCGLLAAMVLPALNLGAQEATPESAPEPAEETTVDMEGLFELGRTLFEAHAPDEVKAQFRYPTREEFDAFMARLQTALREGTLEDLAAYETEARAALVALRAFPDYAPYAEWLRDRLDYIEAAGWIRSHPAPRPTAPATPNPPAARRPDDIVPHYSLWMARVRQRPVPAGAARWAPGLAPIFDAAGVPGRLVWLAEVESSFDPEARSPVGARGLFQFMPGTAEDMGLRLRPWDERTNPEKSAAAAAKYLRQLHGRFGSWPLALAAYNAGPGRVGRLLEARGVRDYAGIADALPAETRMYVPKVLATVAVRAPAGQ